MNKTIKKFFSIALVVAVVFASAPLSGLVGIELPVFWTFSSKAAEFEICPGDTTGSLGHDWSNNDGVCAREVCHYECEHPEDEISWETIVEPSCVPGLERATCAICDIHAPQTIVCDSSTYPESEHSYANSMNKTWDFKYDGATKLALTFSSSTKIENGYDYIYIYNSGGSQVGKYSGTQLSGAEIELEGDSFSIKLTSDGSNVGYGFSFDSIKADIVIDGLSESEIPPIVEHNWNDKTGTCSNGCGTICSHVSYTHGICDVCGGSCTTLGHVFDSNNKCIGCLITGGICGEGLTWTLDEDTGEFAVSGTGEMFNYSSYSSVPWYSYCSQISSIVINSGVESIGGYAFYGCTKAKEIKIANSVETIGTYAFYNCSGLTYIEIPASTRIYNSSYTFYGCSNITKVLMTEGTGTMQTYGTSTSTSSSSTYYQYTPWYISRNKCTEIVIENGVTNIGNYVFYGATGLVDVNIPNSVVSLGNYSFMGCTSITDITIPNDLETIGSYCFNGCTKLQEINIPITVTDIGTYAFYNCSALSKAYFPGTLDQWNSINVGSNNTNLINRIVFESESSQAYYALGTCGENLDWVLYETGELVISGSGDMTDYSTSSTAPWYSKYASKITSLTILEGVTSIGAYAFYSCSKIEDVNIAEGVTVINKYAFYNCSSIEKLIIPQSVTSISDYSFYGCQGIVELSIPVSAKIYNSTNTFYSCNYIKKLTLTKGTGAMQAYSNSSSSSSANTYYQYTPWYKSRSYCSEIVIEDGIENIGAMAFMGCYALKNIEIPDSVTSIGESSFNSCNGLTEIVVPASVVSISNSAFNSCSGLKTVKISEGVETIGSSAFSGCTSLNSVYVPESLNSVAQNAFYNCSNILYTYYPGTPEAWNGISISTSNNNFTAFVVYECNSSKPYYGTGSCGDSVNWILYLSGELIISGTGEMKNYTSSSSVPWYNYNQRITSAVISNGVETLSDYSFYNCVNLEELTIPVSTKIFASSSTVYECESVKKVTFTVGNGIMQDYTESTSQYTPWYKSKSNCKEVVFEDGIKNIGNYAFYDCGISTVSLPADLESIGNYAFSGCYNLVTVELPESLESIGEYAFQGLSKITTIIIPDNVTDIGVGAFKNMSNLETIVLPFVGKNADASGHTGVFGYVFGCSTSTGSTSGAIFQISEKVSYSTDSYYYYIPQSLRDVTITKDVTIPDGAFRNCSFLTQITYPDSITSIGNDAFNGCLNLIGFSLPDSVEYIGEKAFFDSGYYNNPENWENGVLYIDNHLIRANTSISGEHIIKENTISIAAGAFDSCKNLNGIILPENLKKIYDNTFYNCDGLTEIIIPNTVEYIGYGAFYSCNNIVQLTMPISAEIFNSHMTFDGCTKIKKIVFTKGTGIMPTYASDGSNEQYTSYTYTPWYESGSINCIDIVIPKGVISIGAFAFYNCTYLTTVYFSGTEEEFENITINNYNNSLLNANYVFGSYKTYWKSGDTTVEKVFAVGEPVIPPDVPSVSGYSIVGWSPSIPDTMPAETLNFYAEYTPNCYDAVFDANGGSWIDGSECKTVSTAFGEHIISPEPPQRMGYVFSKWSPNVGIMDDIRGKTYIAEWIPSTATAYTVETYTMKANGSYECSTQVLVGVTGSTVNASFSIPSGFRLNSEKSVVNGVVVADNSLVLKVYIDRNIYNFTTVIDNEELTVKYLYGSEISEPNIPQKIGHTFVGWSPSVPNTMPSEDIVLTATFTVNEYDAVFNANGGVWVDGTNKKAVSTKYGANIIAPEVPSRDGYIFSGWTPEIGIMDDVNGKTFAAIWSAATDTNYIVETYTMNTFGEYEKTSQTFSGTTGESVSAEYMVPLGFTLNAYDSVLEGTIAADNSLVLKVYIDRNTYTFTTVVDGVSTPTVYLYGSMVSKPVTPSKTNYKFIKWDGVIPETMPAENITITAEFEKYYVCPDCGNEILGEDAIDEHIAAEENAKIKATIKIKNNNGSKSINYGESLNLTAIVTDKPADAKIYWYVDGEKKGEGETFNVTFEGGTKSVEVKLVDENGIVLKNASGNEIKDIESVTVKSGFFQKLISFFKNLFGIGRTVVQSIRF